MLVNLFLTIMLLNPFSSVYVDHRPIFDLKAIIVKEAPERINIENIGVETKADRFAVIDVDSGEVLLEKDSTESQPIASITKLMTALIILEQKPDWQMEVEMIRADETVGAYPHIYRGELVRFIDLWKAALISSDNNAIKAMIRALGLSEEEFVSKMNEKAAEFNMFSTEFADPTGLDNGNISTALDVAKLVHQAIQKNEIKESVIQPGYSFDILNSTRKRKIYNTDILVESFLNNKKNGYELIGGKTGYLPKAGYCLAVSVKKDENEVIFVVLDSPAIQSRFYDVKVLADWIYTNYKWH